MTPAPHRTFATHLTPFAGVLVPWHSPGSSLPPVGFNDSKWWRSFALNTGPSSNAQTQGEGTDGAGIVEAGRALRWKQQTLNFNLGSSKFC